MTDEPYRPGLSERLKNSAIARGAARADLARRKRREGAGAMTPPEAPAGIWALQSVRLFESIPRAAFDALAPRVRERTVARRTKVPLDDEGSAVFVLATGGAKLCRVGFAGGKLVEALLGPGDLFGRLSDATPPKHYVLETLEATTLLEIPRDGFAELLRQHQTLAYEVVQVLERRERRLVRRIEALVFRDLQARVVETLVDLAVEHGQPCEHGFAVDVRLTEQDLSELVGASRQRVSQVIAKLSRQLFVQRMGRVLCILDRRRLEALAESL